MNENTLGWDCNTGTDTRADGLPAGWCIQPPISGVSMWMDKRLFILKYPNAHDTKRVGMKRTLGNGKSDQYEFVTEGRYTLDPVVWLENPDTGSIQITDVRPCDFDGTLEAISRLQFVPHKTHPRLQILVNSGPVPVYTCFRIFSTSGIADNLVQAVLRQGERRPIFDSNNEIFRIEWRAAEWQRVSLYAPWPPL
jgi:hypothetical protein